MAPRCAASVHPDTLAPVIQTESHFNLYSIGINRDGRSVSSRRFASEAEAVSAAQRLIASGVDNVDLGPAQLNWKAGHLQRRGMSPADAFKPCAALHIAADVLASCWTRAPARGEQARINESLSCYNTGSFTRGLATSAGGNGYAAVVRAAAERIVPALRLAAGHAVPALPSQADPAAAASEVEPAPRCAPPWDPWATLACERRASRSTPVPARQGSAPTSVSVLGGAGTVETETPSIPGVQP